MKLKVCTICVCVIVHCRSNGDKCIFVYTYGYTKQRSCSKQQVPVCPQCTVVKDAVKEKGKKAGSSSSFSSACQLKSAPPSSSDVTVTTIRVHAKIAATRPLQASVAELCLQQLTESHFCIGQRGWKRVKEVEEREKRRKSQGDRRWWEEGGWAMLLLFL